MFLETTPLMRWMSVCQQEPLQTLTLSAVAGELHSYSEVCEALSTLEVALGFLAMTGGEPLMQLSCYLEEVLQMGNQMAAHIVKVSLSETPIMLSHCRSPTSTVTCVSFYTKNLPDTHLRATFSCYLPLF